MDRYVQKTHMYKVHTTITNVHSFSCYFFESATVSNFFPSISYLIESIRLTIWKYYEKRKKILKIHSGSWNPFEK